MIDAYPFINCFIRMKRNTVKRGIAPVTRNDEIDSVSAVIGIQIGRIDAITAIEQVIFILA